MRTLTLLTLIALFPFLGKGQSVTISTYEDSSQIKCLTTGDAVNQWLNGTTSGFTVGDSVDVYVDADDGNGLNRVDSARIDSGGGFWSSWSNTWTAPGTKNMEIIVFGPNGNVSDTLYNTLVISDSCATIQGKAFLDTNGNCYFESGEKLLGNHVVKAKYNNKLVGMDFTNASGTYQIEVPAGQSPYDVMIDSGKYDMCAPSNGVQQVSNPPMQGVNFALKCPQNPDFAVDHGYVASFRPGFSSNIYASFDGPAYCQDSLDCIKVVLDSKLDAYASDSLSYPYDSKNGDTLVWNLDSNMLPDFQHAVLPVMTDTTASIGDTLCVEVLLCASSDSDPSNNSMEICAEVVNSYDPNNKRVLPRGEGAANYIDKNQRMRYVINFQNTGTAPAIDVQVDDTLDSDVLDPNSLRIMGSSHEIDRVQIEEDSIFRFHFKDIMLPDSGKSQADSKGFVRFSVDQKANLSDGTVIENNGAIFFDTNAPIITNEAMNTIGEPTSIQEMGDEAELSVYPNPASDRIHVRSSKQMQGRILLRDMTGKQVLDERFNGTRNSISVSELPSGVYFLSVRSDDGKEPVRKKVMVE